MAALNVAELIGVRLGEIESDREWFADHGRREYRFRPTVTGEPNAGGVLVRRQPGSAFGRYFFDTATSPAAFDVGDSDDLCAALWRGAETAGFASLHDEETGGAAPQQPRRSIFGRLFNR